MTRTNRQLKSTPTRLRRLLCGLTAAAVLGVAGGAATGDDVDAARRTQSAVIADEATSAVEALDRWTRTQNPVDYIWFVQHRDLAASMTERDIELPAGTLRDAWANVSVAKQQTLLSAVSQLGVPYEYLASEPGVGFDCSGLTIWAFAAAGLEIPRVSGDQIAAAEQVDRESAEAGDLVYYPGHISIYLGFGMMVHSPNSGGSVEVAPISDKVRRFGDATTSDEVSVDDSLVDGARAVSE